jgi:hypothetical protein
LFGVCEQLGGDLTPQDCAGGPPRRVRLAGADPEHRWNVGRPDLGYIRQDRPPEFCRGTGPKLGSVGGLGEHFED